MFISKLLAAIAVLTFAASTSSAGAVSVGGTGGVTGGGSVVVGGTVSAPGSGSTGQSGDSSSTPLVQYSVTWSKISDPAHPGFDGVCNAGTVATPIFGFFFHFVGRDSTGAIVDDRIQCIAPVVGGDPANPALPAAPALPTFGEAWNSAQIPAPTVVLDPDARGITGLDTRISTTGPTELILAATIRSYTITGVVTLDHYEISVDGLPATFSSRDHYTFETKGDHTVAISAVWHGIATVTGPDVPAALRNIDLGTATITATRTYPVHEIRSVLQP